MKITKSLFALAALGLASHAMAVPLTFFGEDQGVFNQAGAPIGVATNATAAETAFLANLVGVGTETFEGFADGTGAPLALLFPGAGTATLGGGGSVDDDPGTGQGPISGTNWWRTGADNDFSISFDNPVAAFGFYGIDVGDIGAQLTLTLANGGSIDIDIPHTSVDGGPNSPQNGSVFYFGYIDADNPWTSATFSNIGQFGDDFGFDDMTIGNIDQVQIPEPSAIALIGIGLIGFGLARRRR